MTGKTVVSRPHPHASQPEAASSGEGLQGITKNWKRGKGTLYKYFIKTLNMPYLPMSFWPLEVHDWDRSQRSLAMLQNMRKGIRQTNALGKQQEVPFLLHMDKNKYQTHKHSHFLSICYVPSRAPSTTTLFQFHRREVAVPILQVRNQDSNKTNHNLKELKRKGLNPCLSDTNSFGIFFQQQSPTNVCGN